MLSICRGMPIMNSSQALSVTKNYADEKRQAHCPYEQRHRAEYKQPHFPHYAENREHYHCCGQRVNKRKPGFVGRLRQQTGTTKTIVATTHHKQRCRGSDERALFCWRGTKVFCFSVHKLGKRNVENLRHLLSTSTSGSPSPRSPIYSPPCRNNSDARQVQAA